MPDFESTAMHKAIGAVFLVLVLNSATYADVVLKKDGAKVTGTIVEESSGFIVVEDADGFKILILRTEISSIERAPTTPAGGAEVETPATADPKTPIETPAATPGADTPVPAGHTEAPAIPVVDRLILSIDIPESARKLYEKGAALVEAAGAAERLAEMQDLAGQAISPLIQAYRKSRDFYQAYYQLGIAYQLVDEDAKGRKHLEDCLVIAPDFFQAMCELADILVRDKEFERAASLYDRAIEINPSYTNGYVMRGMYRLSHRMLAEAKADFDKALELEPGEERATALLAQVEGDLKKPAWAKTFVKESAHYIIETNVSDEFATKISETAENAYSLYDLLFQAKEARDMKFPIICYASPQEYFAAGSPQNSGGYYSPLLKKLVLFQYEHWEDTLNVINHEGFHQYLDMYKTGFPQWFNEGHGDFFGFSSYKGGKLFARPNAWRLRTIQEALKSNEEQPLSRLLVMSHAEMYNPRTIRVNYAQAWSFIYFLWRYNDGVYRKYLTNYYRVLMKGADIKEAYKAVFAPRIDALESEWKTYTRGLSLMAEDEELLRRKAKGTGVGE